MKFKRYKKRFASFIFLLCLLSFKFSIAQNGESIQEAYLGTDAEYNQSFSMPSSHKEAWHKFKVISNDRKVITVTTTDINPLNRIESVKLYKGSVNSLQFVMDSYPIQSNDSIVTIFLDTNVVAINDTIFLRLIKGERTNCTTCINNNPLNYRVVLSEQGLCYPATVNLDAHFPFDGATCNISSGQVASACTLKVCAGEPLCLRVSFFKGGVFPMCSPGTVSIPSGAASTPITSSTTTNSNSFVSNYCFTSSTTPGIYQVNLFWRYYDAGYNCLNGEPPVAPPYPWWNCSGSFYIQVGPPAPSNSGYTISPNPVCKGSSACLTANPPIVSGYSYLFETGTSSMSNVISSTGVVCPTYTTAGNIPTALTVYNGFCPSPRATQILPVLNPSVTGTVVKNNCRNYTLSANPMCLPNGVTYTWNVGGVTYTGSPITIDLPGNSASVGISLTASAPTLTSPVVWNSTITNVSTYSASIAYSADGCGNHTFSATPSSCVPANVIYDWFYGATHNYGQTVEMANNLAYGTNYMNIVLTISLPNGTVLYTNAFTQSIQLVPTTCCGNNTVCVNRLGGCTPVTINSTNAATIFSGIQTIDNKMYTVAANTTVTIPSNAQITFNNCSFLMYDGSSIQIDRATNLPANKYSLIFNECYLHGCEKLWEGIKLKNSSGTIGNQPKVLVKKSMIEDAVVALDFSAANDLAILEVENTIFNKNLRGIKFINKSNNYSQFNKLTVTGSVFTSKEFNIAINNYPFGGQTFYNLVLTTANNAALKPKAGVSYHAKSLIGIEVNGVPQGSEFVATANNINISEGIIYDNLVQGVAIKGLNIARFKSNTFKNITSPILNGDYPTYNSTQAGTNNVIQVAAIYYTGKSKVDGANPFTTNAVGSTTNNLTERNKFTNCYYGVYAKDKPFDVTRNDFTDCYNGIYITNADVPPTSNTSVNCNIKSNRIIRIKQTGISLVNNKVINAEIQSNTINNSTGANYTSRAADVSETSPLTTAKYTLLDNTFTKVWNGARINLVYKPVVTHNIISLNTVQTFNSSVNAAPYNTGIHINSCTDPQVNDNSITEPNNTNTWWEQGILVVSSANGRYFCNNVNGTFSAITTGSTCSGTKIYNNDFSNAKFAHWLIFSNVIGDQYNPAASVLPNIQPADNRYYNIAPFHSWTQNTTNATANARFYIRNSNSQAPFQMLNNGNELFSFPVVFPTVPNSENPYNASGCTVLVDPCGGSPSTCRLIGMAHKIAADELYPPIIKRDRFTSRKQLLDNLQKENIGLTGDVDIDNFPTAMENIAVGKFHKVDVLAQQGVDSGDSTYLVQAESMNQSVNPTDVVEDMQKQVNDAYLYHLKHSGELSAEKVDMLKTIAPLCPYEHGSSVWQARALLKPIDNVEYFNVCELYSAPDEALMSVARVLPKEEIIEVKQYFSLYPNPNDGNFKLTLNNTEYANYDIEISNSFGAIVKQYKVNTSESKEDMLVNELTQGIYFVIIKANGVVLETKKVIVTK